MLSPQFYAWVFGLGDKMRILEPKSVADEFSQRIRSISELYIE